MQDESAREQLFTVFVYTAAICSQCDNPYTRPPQTRAAIHDAANPTQALVTTATGTQTYLPALALFDQSKKKKRKHYSLLNKDILYCGTRQIPLTALF